MIDLITSITLRDVFLIFIGPVVFTAGWAVIKGILRASADAALKDPWRIYRYWLAVLSGAAAFWLSDQPALAPSDTLLMIICCLAFYWSVMAQHQANMNDAKHRRVNTAADDEEHHPARESAPPLEERKERYDDERYDQ